jgi:DNA-binding PadR family transcriptional regulator
MNAFLIEDRCHRMSAYGRGRGRGHGRGRRRGFGDPRMAGFFGGRGPRAGRGDVRAAILALLNEEPMHGYQIMNELSERTGGVWRPSPGSIYPQLQLLQDEGLVTATEQDGRRVFALTDTGRTAAAEATGPKPWEAVAGEGDAEMVELRDLVMGVIAAARQVAHTGAPAQVEAAKDVLTDARKRLYKILAEDESE